MSASNHLGCSNCLPSKVLFEKDLTVKGSNSKCPGQEWLCQSAEVKVDAQELIRSCSCEGGPDSGEWYLKVNHVSFSGGPYLRMDKTDFVFVIR